MKARLEDRNRAIEFRRQGLSYKEIQAKLRVSKGLLSGWLSKLPLSIDEKKRLEARISEIKKRGKMNSIIVNQARMLEREKSVIKEAEIMFRKKEKDPVFLAGINLYWSHGARKGNRYQFMTSDTDMVFLMHAWMVRYMPIQKGKVLIRIFIHNSPQTDSIRQFWSKNLRLKEEEMKFTYYKPQNKDIKRNPFYKGTVCLSLGGIRHLRIMRTWQKLLIKKYEMTLLSHK